MPVINNPSKLLGTRASKAHDKLATRSQVTVWRSPNHAWSVVFECRMDRVNVTPNLDFLTVAKGDPQCPIHQFTATCNRQNGVVAIEPGVPKYVREAVTEILQDVQRLDTLAKVVTR